MKPSILKSLEGLIRVKPSSGENPRQPDMLFFEVPTGPEDSEVISYVRMAALPRELQEKVRAHLRARNS